MKSTIRYVIVADTETGGLPSKGGKGKPAKKAFVDIALCEIALVVVDLWEMKIVEEYDAIIAPYAEGLEYNPNAEAVHGLSVTHLTQNGQDIKDVYLATKTYLKKYANSKIGAVLAFLWQRGVGREILGESGVEREHHSALRAEKFVDSACGNDHVG